MSNHFISITGYLGRDPELRYAPSGTPVAHFTMATTFVYTDSQGERQDQTTWFRISAWGKSGENCNEYLRRGSLVQVRGRLVPNEYGSPRIWETQDGESRASYEVTAERVDFLSSRRDNGGPSDDEVPPEARLDDDSIPF